MEDAEVQKISNALLNKVKKSKMYTMRKRSNKIYLRELQKKATRPSKVDIYTPKTDVVRGRRPSS
jgi:hypothetical protein